MKYWLSLITAVLFLFGGCDEQNRCYDPVDTRLVASVKSSDFSNYKNLIVHGVGRTAVNDTLVMDTLSAQSKRFSVPLSLTDRSTGFVLLIGNARDTVYFHHTMLMKFISENCGFAPEYKIDSTTFSPGIDSVIVTDEVVNNQSLGKNINDQNIIIYFNSAVH